MAQMDSRVGGDGLSPMIVPSASPNGSDDDIFAWMFTNPDLFPQRTHLPGMPVVTPEELALPASPLSILGGIKEERDHHAELMGRRSSMEDFDDDDDDDSSSDSNNGARSTTPSLNGTSTSASGNGRSKGAQGRSRSSGASNNFDSEDPRVKRLEKNREIARNCRKRKREKMEALEDEVNKLKEWNRQLELKLKQIPENDAKEQVRKREIQEIGLMMSDQSRTPEDEVSKKLHQYKEVYSDFGRDRKQAITFHLEQLKALLLPNQVSKMTLWILQQGDDFYDEQRNKTTFGGGIWNIICEELRLTEEQKRTLMGMRAAIRGQRQTVGECLRTLKDLEKKIHENITSMGKQMAKIMAGTTPSQQARFLLWIENNQDAVKVLNNIWEHREQHAITQQ